MPSGSEVAQTNRLWMDGITDDGKVEVAVIMND